MAERLLWNVFPDSQIQPKRMPARGIAVVRRLLTDIVRAGHFGHYELLIVHFDLDDTLLETHEHVTESVRWQEFRKDVDELINKLASIGNRTAPLQAIFMTPAQSTDAWLRWAIMDGDGKKWEKMHRNTLKELLFGNPPRKLVEKATAYANRLVVQMGECGQWPRSLRDFQNALAEFKKVMK